MRAAIAAAIGLGAALSATAAAAEFRPLSGRDIRARLTGMEFTDEAHWSYVFGRDGTTTSVSLGRRGGGTWWVDGGRLCMTGGPGTAPCHEVWMDGDRVELRPDTGLPPEEGILRRP